MKELDDGRNIEGHEGHEEHNLEMQIVVSFVTIVVFLL